MQILPDWQSFPPTPKNGVLCVGNFDGVHIGHAAMLRTGREEATKRNIPFTIMTFEPHPNAVLKPNVIRSPLTTPEQRRQLLAQFNPDVLLIINPTREFLSITAEDFLKTIVTEKIAAKLLVEGPTFNFGRGAKGTVDTLQQLGPQFGFETQIVPTQQTALTDLTLVPVSSSLIRWLVEQGRVADAAKCLGRPYALQGTVVEGAKRGRAIGFPTANLQSTQLLPAPGIYAGRAIVDGTPHRAAISIGNNPTFNQQNTTVEAYLLDFDADLYHKTLTLEFHRWIREMLNFSGIDPLVRQIKLDVTQTRQTISMEKA